MKRLLWALGILAIVVLLAGAGLRWYLTSRFVADKVVTTLENAYGGKVRVGAADVWLGNSSVRQIALMEDCPGEVPWLTVDEIHTDLSLFDLLKGACTPGDVQLKGARLVLRFDADGRLLTCLPGKLFTATPGAPNGDFVAKIPQVRLSGGAIVLKKAGSPDLLLQDVNASLERQSGRLVLSGALANPEWGKWRLDGELSKDGPARVTLKSEGTLAITKAMLNQVPFVPASVWKEVDIQHGRTAAVVTVTYDLKHGKLAYRVEAAPTDTDLTIDAIELSADKASGQVVVEDGKVKLTNVNGQAFDGTLSTDADLDFTAETRLDFKRIQAKGLDVAKFPASWRFPKQITGKLFGSAAVQVVLKDTPKGTQVHTSGSGKAKIVDAYVAGQPASDPITLSLKPAGNTFRFSSDESETKADGAWLTALLTTALLPPRPQAIDPLALGAQEKDKEKTKDDSGLDVRVKESYLNINLKMKDIDLGKFARDLDFKLPFTLDGKISFQVKLSIPVDESKDLKKYKLDGWAKLTDLVVGDVKVDDLEGDINYRDGILTMSKLTGRLPADFPGGPAGAFTGSGTFQVEPLGDLKVNVALDRVPISQIGAVSGAGAALKGDLSGTLSVLMPGNELSNPSAWQASAKLTSERLQAFGLTLKDASVQMELAKGKLIVSSLSAKLYEGQASGAALIPLDAAAPGSLNLTLKNVDAAALARDIPKMPVRIAGSVNAELKGTLAPALPGKERTLTVQVDVTAPKLRVQNIPTEQLKGSVEYKNGIVDYRLEGKSLGGTFELEGQIPSEKSKESKKGHLGISNISLGRLLEALGVQDAAAIYEGRLSLSATFTQPASGWPAGAGRFRIADVRYKDTPLINDAAGEVSLTGGKLRISDFSTTFGDGILRAKGAYDFTKPDAGWYAIEMDRVQIAHVLGPWLGLAIEGDMNARIRGNLGREISGHGEIDFGRAKVAGVEVIDWRLPITFRYAPAEERGRLQINDSTAQADGGRIKGKLDLIWEYNVRLEGMIQFNRVDLQGLLRPFVGASGVAGGRLTGRFDFAGRDVRSLKDLSGRLDAAFEQTQALNVPVLKQISPFIGLNPAVTFQKGDVHARLADGFFRIQRLGLEGNAGQIYAEGTVSLEGRLDLGVMATTANLGIDPRLRLLGLRIPATGAIPLLVVQEATTLLSSRVLELRVTGTIRSPNIRILPLATITQEAVRFFLRQTVGDVPFNP